MKPARFLAAASLMLMPLSLWADQAAVHIQPPDLHSPRPLEEQTATSVVRGYLQSWKNFKSAFEQNRADLLNADFVGTALDQLKSTIGEQAAAGITTRYVDQSHDIQIVFYSPDGLSVQLVDKVVYKEQVIKGGKVIASQPIHARFVAVLTPAAARWSVRIFQATRE